MSNLKAADIEISLHHVVGYRGTSTAAGDIVADALSGWHDPRKVNGYFKALLNIDNLYTSDQSEELALLWQLRHSIVHTGGTLTLPDSQKHQALNNRGNTVVVFRPQVLEGAAIWFHRLLKQVHDSYFPKVQARFKTGYVGDAKLMNVKSFSPPTTVIIPQSCRNDNYSTALAVSGSPAARVLEVSSR